MGDNEMKFIVIIFNNNSVQVIPKIWLLDNTTCIFPNYSSENKIRKAVRDKETPGEDWKTYNITIFGTYDSLKKANQMAEQAMINTMLSLNNEDRVEKRIRTKKSFGPEYETDEEHVEEKIVVTGYPLIPDDSNCNYFFDSSNNSTLEPPQKSRRPYKRKLRKTTNEENNMNLSEKDVCCKCADLVRSMSKRMTQMQKDMDTLITLLDTTPSHATCNDLILQKRDYYDIEYLFPVKSLTELQEVEKIIANDPIKRNKIENFIKSFGGKEHDIPVSDILYNIFSNKVAIMFCYEGRNKAKLAAASLGIIQIIRDAILDTCKNSTRNTIKTKMMQWFKDAKKRLSIAENATMKSLNDTMGNSIEN